MRRVDSVRLAINGPSTLEASMRNIITRTGGSFLSAHQKWLVDSGVDATSRSAHEHRVLSRALQLAAHSDRLNIKNLSSCEFLDRRRQLIEEAHREDPKHPNFVSSHLFLGEDESASGAFVAPSLRAFVATEMRREAAILKETRKAKEARAKGRASNSG